ncbi:MAG: hypothetical protein KKB50_00525 [Planctomycetes bacterium]|nr:hypothetical protein [Planctomycetota bacterium]
MNLLSQTCPHASCPGEMCRLTARLVIAEADEVPPLCPNRLRPADPVSPLYLAAAGDEPHVTPRAAALLSPLAGTDHLASVAQLVQARRLVMLRAGVTRPLRANGRARVRNEDVGSLAKKPTTSDTGPWIEIELVDSQDNPVANERYRIKLPDGKTREGRTDQHGRARLDQIALGTCTVSFLDMDASLWERA